MFLSSNRWASITRWHRIIKNLGAIYPFLLVPNVSSESPALTTTILSTHQPTGHKTPISEYVCTCVLCKDDPIPAGAERASKTRPKNEPPSLSDVVATSRIQIKNIKSRNPNVPSAQRNSLASVGWTHVESITQELLESNSVRVGSNSRGSYGLLQWPHPSSGTTIASNDWQLMAEISWHWHTLWIRCTPQSPDPTAECRVHCQSR